MKIGEKFSRLLVWFVPPNLREGDPDILRQAKLVIGFSMLLAVSGMPFALDAFLRGGNILGAVTLGACVLVGLLPLLVKRTGALFLAGHTLLAFLVFILVTLTWMTTGLISTSMMWMAPLPLISILLIGVRSSFAWSFIITGIFTVFYILEKNGMQYKYKATQADIHFDWYTSLVGLTFLVFFLAGLYERSRKEALEKLKEANLQLADARDSAQSANTAKSSFLANMSHEIRTPLNAIIGYSELMMEEAEDQDLPVFEQDLKKVNISGKHLLALINDILDLSKIEAGKMELLIEDYDVPQLIREVRITADPLIAKNQNELEVVIAEGIKLHRADRDRVRQSLLNLLSNASKFTEQGKIKLAVSQKDREGCPWLSFRVEDTGIGMTPEQCKNLFQEYSQADNSTQKKYGGTGLGLALSQGFCQLMGGRIFVESELGKGTAFEIVLPLQAAG